MQVNALSQLMGRLERAGVIASQDVLAMRRIVFGGGVIGRTEAELLFDLMQKRLPACAEWPEFFIEALVDYIVHQVEPEGYVDSANAAWLMRMVARDKTTWSDTELELLLQIMEKARSAPEELELFVLDAVREAVVRGAGPTRRGLTLRPGIIGAAEIDVVRRALYAAGGSANVAISRPEADMLFDINDATLAGQADPAWSDLFVKAVANHLLAVSGYRPPSREQALRRAQWLDETDVSVGGFLGRMATGWADLLASYGAGGSREPIDAEAEQITPEEAEWLRDRIQRNGKVCPAQQALLTFLRDQTPRLHPLLRDMLPRAA